jgi:hypothetical protein
VKVIVHDPDNVLGDGSEPREVNLGGHENAGLRIESSSGRSWCAECLFEGTDEEVYEHIKVRRREGT